MIKVKNCPSYKTLCVVLSFVYLFQIFPAYNAHAATPWDVTKQRAPLWNKLNAKMNKIVNKYDTPQNPWRLSNGKINTNHPMYKIAKGQYKKAWNDLWKKARSVDYMNRRRAMQKIFKTATKLAKQKGIELDLNETFNATGTPPYKGSGRGVFTDLEHTADDKQTFDYVVKACRRHGYKIKVNPGENNIHIEEMDWEIWSQPGKGNIHDILSAYNAEHATSAIPNKDVSNVPVDKMSAAFEQLKKFHPNPHGFEAGSFEEYSNKVMGPAKAIERINRIVGGHSSTEIELFNQIRSGKIDPVEAGIYDLGDSPAVRSSKMDKFNRKLQLQLSKMMKKAEALNEQFIRQMDSRIKATDLKGNKGLSKILRDYKNKSLRKQNNLRKAMIKRDGIKTFAEIQEGVRFERFIKNGKIYYRNTATGQELSKFDMIKKYRDDPIARNNARMSKELSYSDSMKRQKTLALKANKALSFDGVKVRPGNQLPKEHFPRTSEMKAKNHKVLEEYAKIARRLINEEIPELAKVPGAEWAADPKLSIYRYIEKAEIELSKDPKLLKIFKHAKKLALKAHVRRQLEVQQETYWREQARAIKTNQERRILRAREMYQKAKQDEAIKKFMVRLFLAAKLTSFLRIWYDGGAEGLREYIFDVVPEELFQMGITMAVIGGAQWAFFHLNYTTALAVFNGLLAHLGGTGAVMMIYMIGESVTYMTVDYFILEDNRKALIQSLYPLPPQKTNEWDFWHFYHQTYGEEIKSSSDLYKIAQRIEEDSPKYSATKGDLVELMPIMVNRYRSWVIKEKQYKDVFIKRWDYFENDPKIWSAIASDLANRVYMAWKYHELDDVVKAIGKAQRAKEDAYFMEPVSEKKLASQAIITGVSIAKKFFNDYEEFTFEHIHRLNDNELHELQAGDTLIVDVEYLFWGVPGETAEITLTPELNPPQGEAIPFTKKITTKASGDYETGVTRFELPMQYPTKKDQSVDTFFTLAVDKEKTFKAVIMNALTIKGPGSDFDGFADLHVTLGFPEDSIYMSTAKIFYPKSKVTLKPLGGQEAQAPQEEISNTFDFKDIPLGQWKVIAEVTDVDPYKTNDTPPQPQEDDDEDFELVPVARSFIIELFETPAYAAREESKKGGDAEGNYNGPKTGSKEVTLFTDKPFKPDTPKEERHIGSKSVLIKMGKFEKEDDIKKRKAGKWKVVVNLQDEDGKPVVGAQVSASVGDKAGEELGEGKYMLGHFKGSDKKVSINASAAYQSAQSGKLVRRYGKADANYTGSAQVNVTIVIKGLSQPKWTIFGSAQYKDGTSLLLKPGDVFDIAMTGMGGDAKEITGVAYRFGPFGVAADSNADNPKTDSNKRSFSANVLRGGKMIAQATGSVRRKGEKETEYNIAFSNYYKNILEPDDPPDDDKGKDDPLDFVNNTDSGVGNGNNNRGRGGDDRGRDHSNWKPVGSCVEPMHLRAPRNMGEINQALKGMGLEIAGSYAEGTQLNLTVADTACAQKFGLAPGRSHRSAEASTQFMSGYVKIKIKAGTIQVTDPGRLPRFIQMVSDETTKPLGGGKKGGGKGKEDGLIIDGDKKKKDQGDTLFGHTFDFDLEESDGSTSRQNNSNSNTGQDYNSGDETRMPQDNPQLEDPWIKPYEPSKRMKL